MPFDSAAYLGALAQGNRAMFAGITSAGDSIAGGIRDYKKEKAEDKAANAIYDALSPEAGEDGSQAAHPFGITKDQFSGMSRADRLALTQGKVEALSIKNAIARMKREQEEQQYEQMQRQAGAQFQSRLNTGDGVTAQDMIAAASESGYQMPPQVLNQMMREGDGANQFEFDPSKVVNLEAYGLPGQAYVPTSKGGGQIRSTFDPAQAGEGGIEEATDDDGNVYKFWTNPKTGARTILSRPKPKPSLPSSAQTALTEAMMAVQQDESQMKLSDDVLKAQFPALKPPVARSMAENRLKGKRAEVKALIDLQHKLGAVDDAMRDSLYADYGITPTKGGPATVRKFNPKTGKIE